MREERRDREKQGEKECWETSWGWTDFNRPKGPPGSSRPVAMCSPALGGSPSPSPPPETPDKDPAGHHDCYFNPDKRPLNVTGAWSSRHGPLAWPAAIKAQLFVSVQWTRAPPPQPEETPRQPTMVLNDLPARLPGAPCLCPLNGAPETGALPAGLQKSCQPLLGPIRATLTLAGNQLVLCASHGGSDGPLLGQSLLVPGAGSGRLFSNPEHHSALGGQGPAPGFPPPKKTHSWFVV